MPMYDYFCHRCDRRETAYRKIAERKRRAPVCCMKHMSLVIVAPMIQPDIPAYQSPIDGRPIESRKQRHEDFKRNGCRPWEGLEQEKKVAAQETKYIEAKKEQILDKAAHEAYYELAPSKRDALKWLTEHS